jgi:hypothetical protein
MALISLQHAKDHLSESTDDRDSDIQNKLEQAQAIVLARCNSTAHWRAITPTWTSNTVPGGVKAAILLVLTHLVENKGDNMETDSHLWEAVENLIRLHKDPVIA